MSHPNDIADMLFIWRVTQGDITAPEGWDRAMTEATVHALADFAGNTLAPANAIGDREGCRIENGKVVLPEAFDRAYAAYVEQGLHLLGLSETHGGMNAPRPVRALANELMAGANHAFQMLVSLVPGAAQIIAEHGTPEQAERLITPLASGDALATMCLTESDAGSDLSGIRTQGEKRPDGSWAVSGTKIFASGGGQSMSRTILHMVLARSGAREDGRPLLSLFAVPAAPEVRIRRIEEKLGLHASPTCTLEFAGAPAELIGEEGKGLAYMFTLMNEARIDVAMQAVGHAGAALNIARSYAETRTQGRNPDGKPAAIARHGDVRRMLDGIAADVIGLRAMCLLALAEENAAVIDFLTPVCKAYVTDSGCAAVDTAMQVLGGYGYLPEYGIERHWRDVRITRIYEGTNGIMAMTLATRLLDLDDGVLGDRFAANVRTYAKTAPEPAGKVITEMLALWQKSRAAITQISARGQAATAFLTLTGHLWQACAWGVLLAKASEATDPERLKYLGENALYRARADAGRQAVLVQWQSTLAGADL